MFDNPIAFNESSGLSMPSYGSPKLTQQNLQTHLNNQFGTTNLNLNTRANQMLLGGKSASGPHSRTVSGSNGNYHLKNGHPVPQQNKDSQIKGRKIDNPKLHVPENNHQHYHEQNQQNLSSERKATKTANIKWANNGAKVANQQTTHTNANNDKFENKKLSYQQPSATQHFLSTKPPKHKRGAPSHGLNKVFNSLQVSKDQPSFATALNKQKLDQSSNYLDFKSLSSTDKILQNGATLAFEKNSSLKQTNIRNITKKKADQSRSRGQQNMSASSSFKNTKAQKGSCKRTTAVQSGSTSQRKKYNKTQQMTSLSSTNQQQNYSSNIGTRLNSNNHQTQIPVKQTVQKKLNATTIRQKSEGKPTTYQKQSKSINIHMKKPSTSSVGATTKYSRAAGKENVAPNQQQRAPNHKETSPKNQSMLCTTKVTSQLKRAANNDVSISSFSSNTANNNSCNVTKILQKNYFVDGQKYLRHFSPDEPNRTYSPPDYEVYHQRHCSDENRPSISYKSNLVAQNAQQQQITSIQHAQPAERDLSKNSRDGHIDRLVRQNIRDKKSQHTEELLKKYMQEDKLKQKKQQLSKRNQEIKKLNAFKVHDKSRQKALEEERKLEQLKKTLGSGSRELRSKSQVNRTENYIRADQHAFQHNNRPRNKSNENKTASKKFEKKSIYDLKQLKEEVDAEISREQNKQQVKRLLDPNNLSSGMGGNSQIANLNVSSGITCLRRAQVNQSSIFSDCHLKTQKVLKPQKVTNLHKKSKTISGGTGSGITKINNSKIQKFIEKQKKLKLAKKSLEETIEYEKYKRIRQNLLDLHKFVQKTKNQKQQISTSQQIDFKKNSSCNNISVVKSSKVPQKILRAEVKKATKKSCINHTVNFDTPNVIDRTQPLFLRDQIITANMQNEQMSSESLLLMPNSLHNNKGSTQAGMHHTKSCTQKYYSTGLKGQQKKLKASQLNNKSRTKKQKEQFDDIEDVITMLNDGNNTIIQDSTLQQVDSFFSVDKKHTKQINKQSNKRSSHSKQKSLQIPTTKSKNKQASIHNTVSISRSDSRSKSRKSSNGSPMQPRKVKKQGNKQSTKQQQKLSTSVTILQKKQKQQKQSNKQNLMVESINSNADVSYEAVNKKSSKKNFQASKGPRRYNHQQSQSQSQSNKKYHSSGNSLSEYTNSNGSPLRLKQSSTSPLRKSSEHYSTTKKDNINEADADESAYEQLEIKEQQQSDVPSQSQSQRLKVPQLNLDQIQHKKQNQAATADKEQSQGANTSSVGSIFERNSFQELLTKQNIEEFNVNNYPEMLKIREEAIKFREQIEQKYIQKMYKSKQYSPQTYQKKRKELEIWVTKEQEEVKKTKKQFQQELQRTAKIIQNTQQNSAQIKRILEEGNLSVPALNGKSNISQRDRSQNGSADLNDVRLSSNRIVSSRQDSKLLDMIYNNKDNSTSSLDNPSNMQSDRGPVLKHDDQAILLQVQACQSNQNNALTSRSSLQQSPQSSYRRRNEHQQKRIEEKLKQTRVEVSKLEEEMREKDLQEKRQAQREMQKKIVQNEKQFELQRLLKEQQALEDFQQLSRSSSQQLLSEPDLLFGSIGQKRETTPIDIDKQQLSILDPTKQQQLNEDEIQKELFRAPSFKQFQQQQDSSEVSEDQKNQVQQQSSEKKKSPEIQINNNQIGQNQQMIETTSPESQATSSNNENISKDVLRDNFFLNQAKDSSSMELQEAHKKYTMNSLNDCSDEQQEDNQSTTIKQGSINQQNHNQLDLFEPSGGSLNQDNNLSLSIPNESNSKIFIEINGKASSSQHQNMEDYLNSRDVGDISSMGQTSVPNVTINNSPNPVIDIDNTDKTSLNNLQQHQNNLLDMNPVVIPVSPASQTSTDMDIIRGSVSLENSASSGNHSNPNLPDVKFSMEKIISQELSHESLEQQHLLSQSSQDSVNNSVLLLTPDLIKKGELLAEEIYIHLVQELQIEMEFMVNREKIASRRAMREMLKQNGQPGDTGIQTDLFAIEKYVDELQNEVKETYEQQFFKEISSPLTKDAVQLIGQIQNSKIGESCEHFFEQFPQVLPLEIYLSMEKRRKDKLNEEDDKDNNKQAHSSQGASKSFLAECQHIHNKVLFDCINDALIQFKPYGKSAYPLPWSRRSRRLKPNDEFTLGEIFEIVKHDLFRMAIMQAGCLPRREFVYQGAFDEELFGEVREKKLVTLLAREMIENEPKWLNYEYEETQVKIDLADMVLEHLVKEIVQFCGDKS